jgi:hypothetical protein
MSNMQQESISPQDRTEPAMPRTVHAIATLSDAAGRPSHTAALRGLLSRVGDTCKKPVKRALHVRDTTALIRMSDSASEKVDSLISAGVFKTRGEAAAFLFEEGIKAGDAMFRRVSQQLGEIETLRTEVRNGHSNHFN